MQRQYIVKITGNAYDNFTLNSILLFLFLQLFLPLFTGKRCDVTHQYKQIQNGGTETMQLILKCMFFLDKSLWPKY